MQDAFHSTDASPFGDFNPLGLHAGREDDFESAFAARILAAKLLRWECSLQRFEVIPIKSSAELIMRLLQHLDSLSKFFGTEEQTVSEPVEASTLIRSWLVDPCQFQ